MRITFGRYIPRNSVIHKMDPRLKLGMIIVLIVAIFFSIGFTGYLIAGAIIFTMFAAAKLSWRMLVSLLFPVGFMFIIIVFMNAFFLHPSTDVYEAWLNSGTAPENAASFIGQGQFTPDGKEVMGIGHYAKVWIFWFSEKSIYTALIMGMRIYLMILLTSILTSTTQPIELTLAIEDILSPLKLIRVPVYILSMIISIALRMIPTLIDEAGRIMKAQSSRGIDIKNGKFKDKSKGLVSLIIPLLVSSFQKAEDLAYAMDARGYDPYAKRTRFVQFKFKIQDLLIFLVGLGLAVFLITYASTGSLQDIMALPIDWLVL